MMTRNTNRVPVTPGQIYLLHSDRPALAAACRGMRAADVADALRQVAPDAAARIVAAVPFDLAVQVHDEPELHRHRSEIIRLLDGEAAGPLIDAMSGDEQAKLRRALPAHRSDGRDLRAWCRDVWVVSGAMLPFLIKRIGFDPATASAPFVATLVDVTGILIYFSVALLLLRGTLL